MWVGRFPGVAPARRGLTPGNHRLLLRSGKRCGLVCRVEKGIAFGDFGRFKDGLRGDLYPGRRLPEAGFACPGLWLERPIGPLGVENWRRLRRLRAF